MEEIEQGHEENYKEIGLTAEKQIVLMVFW